jgi:hypothetical protein
MIEPGSLSLSAQRAFLERITPCMRLIKVETVDGVIVLTCLTDRLPSAFVKELVSEAGSEIISDFPDANITEIVQQHHGKLPIENIIEHGWIYARYESS